MLMSRRHPIHLLLVIAGVLATANAVAARRLVPVAIRMIAYVNDKPAAAQPEYVWTVAHGQTQYQLYVMKLSIVRGSMLPSALDQAVRPYKVAFQVVGPRQIMEKFIATKPGQRVIIGGDLRFSGGARTLLLNTVEDSPEAPGSK